MSGKEHRYRPVITWIGNTGEGTASYKSYERAHVIGAPGKTDIAGSSDAAFRGDAARWNPEDMFVASASTCHMLWYLHLCADAGIAVQGYVDEAVGTMVDSADRGHFTRIVLHPRVAIRAGDNAELAAQLHHQAHAHCYIANSVNFPIECEPVIDRAAA